MNSALQETFSIIIPIYNRSSLIDDALNSVKLQLYRPIEIIVVDDGSTDESADVVKAWKEKNEEKNALALNYFFQPNTGAGAARNRGIKEVSGVFVQYLDSDDRLHPERLQRLVDVFNETGADFIQTGFEGFDPNSGEVIQQHFAREGENQLELALKGLLWANTLRSAFRKSLIEKTGLWDTSMTCFEDREYVERAVARAEKPIAIRDVLASARRGGSSRISDILQTREGRGFRILCEERLANEINARSDISLTSKQVFASRLYALGFRSNASGWNDLGKRCGKLAESLGVELDKVGKRRRMVWGMGKWGGRGYELLHRLKSAVIK